jgi:outer membrane protein assembly factor BamB
MRPRGSAARWVLAALIGAAGLGLALAGCLAGFLAPYLLGVALLAGALALAGRALRGRLGLLAGGMVALVLAAVAVAGPWWSARSLQGAEGWTVHGGYGGPFLRGSTVVTRDGFVLDPAHEGVSKPDPPLPRGLTAVGPERFYSYDANNDVLRALDGHGTVLWTLGSNARSAPDVIAEAGDVTVVTECPIPRGQSTPCTYRGIGRDGGVLWTRTDLGEPSAYVANYDLARTFVSGFERRDYVPRIVVGKPAGGTLEAVVLDPTSGRTLLSAPGVAGVLDDTAVVAHRRPDGSCQLQGIRGDRIVWTARVPDCSNPGPPRPVPGRVYLSVDGGWVTVDGRDGSFRRVAGPYSFGIGPTDPVAGSQLVVGRAQGDDHTLIARDARTGKEVWRRTVAGSSSPRVTIFPGGVVVTARSQTLNPFIGRDEREETYTVTRLDPRTGRPTAELHTDSAPGAAMALDEGRLAVQTHGDFTITGAPDG